jgi:hypothetical protein
LRGSSNTFFFVFWIDSHFLVWYTVYRFISFDDWICGSYYTHSLIQMKLHLFPMGNTHRTIFFLSLSLSLSHLILFH